MVKKPSAVIARSRLVKVMLTGIRIIGLGIWVAILSMAISAFLCRHGTEEDIALVFVAIMDFIVIMVTARTIKLIFTKSY
jgi:hypothetical protein